MPTSTDALGRLIRRQLPDAFLRRALQAVFVAHNDAWTYTSSAFAPSEAANVVGFIRRAHLEANLRAVAELVPGFAVETVNGPDSNWNHVEVHNDPVVLTANSVPYPCGMVDPANFRETLAEGNQLSFWDDDARPQAAELFVVLLHSKYRGPDGAGDRSHAHLPGSAYIACPSPGFKSYLWELNLFDAYPGVVQQYIPNSWDQEARVHYHNRSRKSTWQAYRLGA